MREKTPRYWRPLVPAAPLPESEATIRHLMAANGRARTEVLAMLAAQHECPYWGNDLYRVRSIRGGGIVHLNIWRSDGRADLRIVNQLRLPQFRAQQIELAIAWPPTVPFGGMTQEAAMRLIEHAGRVPEPGLRGPDYEAKIKYEAELLERRYGERERRDRLARPR